MKHRIKLEYHWRLIAFNTLLILKQENYTNERKETMGREPKSTMEIPSE